MWPRRAAPTVAPCPVSAGGAEGNPGIGAVVAGFTEGGDVGGIGLKDSAHEKGGAQRLPGGLPCHPDPHGQALTLD